MFDGLRLFGAIIGLSASAGTAASANQPGAVNIHYVFFDWGKSTISRDSVETLDAIAAAMLRDGTRASIIGHSDRSGSATANRHSSFQRAIAVRDHLIRKNVPSTQLAIAAVGEEKALIATENGVREPQNRRVEVILGRPAPESPSR